MTRKTTEQPDGAVGRLDELLREDSSIVEQTEQALRILLRMRAAERIVRVAAVDEPLTPASRRLLSIFEGQDIVSAYGALEHWTFVRRKQSSRPPRPPRPSATPAKRPVQKT